LAVTVHRTYIPQPPLAAFVDKLWLYEGDAPPHAKERRLPDGSMELVINLRDDTIRVYDRQHHNQFQSFRGSLMCGAPGFSLSYELQKDEANNESMRSALHPVQSQIAMEEQQWPSNQFVRAFTPSRRI
jgi:hypothetical protein